MPLLVLAAIVSSNTARADAVVDWNAIASEAILTAAAAGRATPATSLDFALVHIAIHDAVQAIDKRFQPYHSRIPGATGSPAAATAKAAHDVLRNLFPTQSTFLSTAYNDFLSKNGLTESDPGVAVGQKAASDLILLRASDGRYPTNQEPFNGSTERGAWRPTNSYLSGTPAPFSPMAVPWLRNVTPFTIRGTAQFRPVPPPSLTSARYTRDYDEVRRLGSLQSSERTAEETGLAYFWADNTIAKWNATMRGIASAKLTKIGDSARLFALANMAIADAVITTWENKYRFNFWRPVTAIQEDDGNPDTIRDSNWQPLINNPNYPDYTSGANAVTGAATRTLEHFFDSNRMTFTMPSTHPLADPKVRTYRRFTDAAEDVVDARILLGIHFRFADTEARRLGVRVANWAFPRYLQPIGE